MSKAPSPDRDQTEVEAFLSDPGSYRPRPERVDRLDTHGAMVFLAGDEVWKIKRAVDFQFMDFSTLAKREAVCRREIEVNRTWAPDLYLDCVPITRAAGGGLEIGGQGAAVEWAVHMRRFPQEALLAWIAGHQGVSSALARELADTVFDGHELAQRIDGHDASAAMRRLAEALSNNIAHRSDILPPDLADRFRAAVLRQQARVSELMTTRAREGFVRRCHGDSHLGNIVLWNGKPMLFDAIEFDEDVARIDTLYDLAFLLMDLDHRGFRAASNTVLNRYLWRSGALRDIDGLAALPFYLGLRAGVRAMVTAERAAQKAARKDDEQDRITARGYLKAALDYLDPGPPRLIAVAGLSGTGKSTLAARLAPGLAPAPGAVHLRSDLERKKLFGAAETDRLGPDAYTVAAAASVYETLLEKARRAIAAGHSVVVDAVYARPGERLQLEKMADALGTPLSGQWLSAAQDTLASRVAQRRNDASDATVEIVRQQRDYDIGELSAAWTVIDAGRDIETTARQAEAVLAGR